MEKNLKNREIKRKNENNFADDYFINTFYTPFVENETESSMNGFYDFNDTIAFLEYLNEYIDEGLNDFSSDDSVKDPNYAIPEDTSDESADDNMENLELIEVEDFEMKNLEAENSQMEQKQATYFPRKKIQFNRNRGKAYTTKTGKEVSKRQCTPLKTCRKHCKDKLSHENQKVNFDNYWGLGSYNQRLLFMLSLIEVEEKASQITKKSITRPKNRQNTVFYYIEVNGVKINLCKSCFLATFGETECFIRTVISKKCSTHPNSLKDNRGKAKPTNKLSEEKVESIKNHIMSFPAYESHYSRSHSSKKYLSSNLNISKMYELYCEQNEPVSITKYSEIFHTFNYKFKRPKIDTCNKCDTFKAKLDHIDTNVPEYLKLKDEQNRHHEKAQQAYKAKEHDKKLSKENGNIKMFTFDLQQCLPTPYLKTSVCYYKRQLNTYNLTVHDCVTNKPYCYMWHEGEGKRGGNEISSCLLSHLSSLSSNSSIDSVILYSDSCAGQNKNSYVSSMFTYFLRTNENIKTIDHKFLEPGHTHMECDVDHALIEKKKKNTDIKIHHPRDWYQFVRSVGKKNEFVVVDMDHTKFFDFCLLSKTYFVFKTNDKSASAFSWKDVKWLRYSKDKIGTIEYKNSLFEEEAFKVLHIRKRGINILETTVPQTVQPLPKISKEKKKDLLSVIDLIDPCFHDFYRNLKTDDIPDMDPDIIPESSDEE